MIRERALVAKKRFLSGEEERAPQKRTLHVSLDKADAVIDGMTISGGGLTLGFSG
jgi:hypothetical protein